MTDLGDFLLSCAARERNLGVWDCGTFPAEWVQRCGFPDPMAVLRGAYDAGGEDQAVTTLGGDLAAVFDERLASIGIFPTDDAPRAGDIGVVDIGGLQAGSIFTGKRWAFVAQRGIGASSVDPEHIVRVWRVPYE